MDILDLARELAPWAGAVFAVAVALRTHATSSAGTIRQLQTWLSEARREILTLRDRVQVLELDRDRLAAEVERLTPYEARASSLAAELRELRSSVGAGGRAATRSPRHPEVASSADVVHLRPRGEG